MSTIKRITYIGEEVVNVLCSEGNTIRIKDRSETVDITPIDIDPEVVSQSVVIYVEL